MKKMAIDTTAIPTTLGYYGAPSQSQRHILAKRCSNDIVAIVIDTPRASLDWHLLTWQKLEILVRTTASINNNACSTLSRCYGGRPVDPVRQWYPRLLLRLHAGVRIPLDE